MKNIAKWMPLLLLLLLVLSWYKLYSEKIEVIHQYDSCIAEAREYAGKGITKYALEKYNAALEIKNTPELYVEAADYLYSQGESKKYVDWCEDFIERYPDNSLAFDCVVRGYLKDEVYDDVYEMLDEAYDRGIYSEYLDQVRKEIYNKYDFGFAAYEDVGIFSNYFCAVKSDGRWGYVNRYGELKISCKYTEAGVFTSQEIAPVVTTQGKTFFIDQSGAKVLGSTEEYASFGCFAGGMVAARLENGKYIYLNSDLMPIAAEGAEPVQYDYAGAMNGGVAAVQQDGKWYMLDESLSRIGENSYEDIKLDGKEICFRNGGLFAKTDGKYYLLDASGNRISEQGFDDAMPFFDSTYAAVKIGNDWKFIDNSGQLRGSGYSEARSYSNGYAAVKIAGKWGFIDLNDEVAIEPAFFAVNDFNEKGSCFVNTGTEWQMLKLYRLNRR